MYRAYRRPMVAIFTLALSITQDLMPQAYTQLDEEDHGQGAEATHALAEVVTTIGHVSDGFLNSSNNTKTTQTTTGWV